MPGPPLEVAAYGVWRGGRAILGSVHTSCCHTFYPAADTSAVIPVTHARDLRTVRSASSSPQLPLVSVTLAFRRGRKTSIHV